MQLSVDAQLASLLSAQHWCQWTRMHAFLSCAFSSMCVWLITWLQVALLTHRTPVLPDLPCETAWLHANRVDDGRRAPEAVCRPPVLTGEPWVSPLPVPYLADERGELVGGVGAGTRAASLTCDASHPELAAAAGAGGP